MPLLSTLRQLMAVLCAATFVFTAAAAHAQSGGQAKPPEPQKPAADAAKDSQRKIDEIAEAGKVLTGAAGNPECVWLGRRAVSRLLNDDLDAAFRHMDLYDRFGCPSAHIQAAFRCLARQGNIELRQQEDVNVRVHACWLDPTMERPAAAASAAPAPASSGQR